MGFVGKDIKKFVTGAPDFVKWFQKKFTYDSMVDTDV